MKILSLTLKNFSRVLTGLGKTQLDIDFNSTEFRVNLFSGENGTGKTSIMSCLHPFAFNTNMDNRDNSQLIIEGKSGEKTLKLQHNDLIYTIRHLYKRSSNGSLTVKSYISDGIMELNPAGNVTEFKEIIFNSFGLDETFLSLLTLGVNVSGFIDKSDTERKNFSAKIFEELGIFNAHYKRVNNNARVLKSLMTNISSKLVKYKNLDVDDLKKTLRQLEVRERKVYEEIRKVTTEMGSINSLIDTKRDTINKYESKKTKLSSLLDELSRLRSTKLQVSSRQELLEKIESLNKTLFDYTVSKVSLETNINNLLESVNSKRDSLYNLKLNQSKLTSNSNFDDMIKLQTSLELNINNIKAKLNNVALDSYTREELIKCTIHLDELMNQCGDLLLLDSELIIRVYSKYRTDSNLEQNVIKSIRDNTFNIKNYELLKVNNIDLDTTIDDDCSDPNCPYKKFYQMYINQIKNNNRQSIEDMNKVKDTIASLENILEIITIIKRVDHFIEASPLLLTLPKTIFDIDKCIVAYATNREIYNKTKLVELIDLVEERDKLQSLEDKLQTINEKINHYKDSKEVLDDIEHQIGIMDIEVLNNLENIQKYRESLSDIKTNISKLNTELELLNRDLSTMDMINDKKIEMEKLSDEIREMDSTMEDINKLLSKKDELRRLDISLNQERNEINRELSDLKLTISDYESLKEEEAQVTEKYDKYVAIREALSPSKGIPTIFIESYVKSMAEFVNELLDLVYGGTLRICGDSINVDENEFSIPYVKNGTKINDISNASQGERSFLSLAFSLSMLKLSSGEYNIMLLDEADTTLDTASRNKFIPILDKYLDSINSEQVFIISHNNMFDSYPVELILTSPDNTSNKNANNIIKLY